MTPLLFGKHPGAFTTLGLGFLPAWLEDSIEVIEERNGQFYLQGTMPADGLNVRMLTIEQIILAAPAPGKPAQPFRIEKIIKDSIANTVEIYAPHISYQLAKTAVRPVDDASPPQYATAQAAMNILWRDCAPSMNGVFTPYSDITPSSPLAFNISTPTNLRNALGGVEGSMIDTFGGELEWDVWTVKLLAARGRVTDKMIRYGVNMDAMDFDTDAQNLVTGYVGYAKKDDITIMSDIVYLDGASSWAFPRIELIDFTENFRESEFVPSTPELTDLTADAIAGRTISLKTSITIEAVPEELQGVYLCDTVTVVHPVYDLMQTAKIVRTVYDPIKERYKEITIGEIQKSITDTIAGLMGGR